MSLSTALTALAAVLSLVAVVWCVMLMRRLAALEARGKGLSRLAAEGDLKGLGRAVEDRLSGLDERVMELKADDAALADRLTTAMRHVGLLRYDAFPDAAGEQSFSVALLDDSQRGFLVTSLYGRDEYRMYAKPLEGGRSPFRLTKEEQEAIDRALSGIEAEVADG